jgi:hypothetical protein
MGPWRGQTPPSSKRLGQSLGQLGASQLAVIQGCWHSHRHPTDHLPAATGADVRGYVPAAPLSAEVAGVGSGLAQ